MRSITVRCLLLTAILAGTPFADPEAPNALAANPAEARKGYAQSLRSLARWRDEQAGAYQDADKTGKAKIRNLARTKLLGVLEADIFPAWYGTKWDFNGISQVPGEGAIACGYFVSTCLRDAGFKVPRVRMAQQPSQRIIEALTTRKERRITAGATMDEIEDYLDTQGAGIYVVGLDRHVGFILVTDRKKTFVHSSYYSPPRCVISEPIRGRNPLADSNYRVIGKLLGDDLLGKWLREDAIPVQTSNR